MTVLADIQSMALFCDFENIALGVRDEKYARFEIRKILERLLLKGNIVVKKAYCDWERYKEFKKDMHEAAFELIEIPHVRQSGKNSADIRMVVDALDLCYTKSHVDTFVLISGDSDFSPLVSKLRENNKVVIGVGVRSSTSDLLIANCDEFIFYDDFVVREETQRKVAAKKVANSREKAKSTSLKPEKPVAEYNEPPAEQNADEKKLLALHLVVSTVEQLIAERGGEGLIAASAAKNAIKRIRPGFSESEYGYKAFGKLLEDAEKRGLLKLDRPEKGGLFISL